MSHPNIRRKVSCLIDKRKSLFDTHDINFPAREPTMRIAGGILGLNESGVIICMAHPPTDCANHSTHTPCVRGLILETSTVAPTLEVRTGSLAMAHQLSTVQPLVAGQEVSISQGLGFAGS